MFFVSIFLTNASTNTHLLWLLRGQKSSSPFFFFSCFPNYRLSLVVSLVSKFWRRLTNNTFLFYKPLHLVYFFCSLGISHFTIIFFLVLTYFHKLHWLTVKMKSNWAYKRFRTCQENKTKRNYSYQGKNLNVPTAFYFLFSSLSLKQLNKISKKKNKKNRALIVHEVSCKRKKKQPSALQV